MSEIEITASERFIKKYLPFIIIIMILVLGWVTADHLKFKEKMIDKSHEQEIQGWKDKFENFTAIFEIKYEHQKERYEDKLEIKEKEINDLRVEIGEIKKDKEILQSKYDALLSKNQQLQKDKEALLNDKKVLIEERKEISRQLENTRKQEESDENNKAINKLEKAAEQVEKKQAEIPQKEEVLKKREASDIYDEAQLYETMAKSRENEGMDYAAQFRTALDKYKKAVQLGHPTAQEDVNRLEKELRKRRLIE